MKVTDIKNGGRLKPLKLSVRETPHLTIETNLTCNIRCRGCYNIDKTQVKSLSQIMSEIDLALQKRNVETITLLGGEPTLHPDLTEIIKYTKSKKVICQMLTNGVTLLQDRSERLLEGLIQAGLDRIVVHVDEGQSHIHENIHEVRHRLFKKFEARKLFFSLSVTIYRDNAGSIPGLMREFSRYRFFDGILGILEMSPAEHFSKDFVPGNSSRLFDEYDHISTELGIEPGAYIPTSLDDKSVSWLMFFYYINTRTRRTWAVSPEFNRLFRTLYRICCGRHVFGITTNPRLFPLSFLLTCLAEAALHPKRLPKIAGIIRKSRRLRDLRFHYILLQQGPAFNPDKNRFQLCYHCPDATIRNGKLTPVCAADLINPLGNADIDDERLGELRRAIYGHLEQN